MAVESGKTRLIEQKEGGVKEYSMPWNEADTDLQQQTRVYPLLVCKKRHGQRRNRGKAAPFPQGVERPQKWVKPECPETSKRERPLG